MKLDTNYGFEPLESPSGVGVSLKTRLIVAVLALLSAGAIGFLAPDPSTAALYRMAVIAFVMLTGAFRCLTFGILDGTGATGPPGDHLSRSKTRQAASYHSTPLLVRNSVMTLALSY